LNFQRTRLCPELVHFVQFSDFEKGVLNGEFDSSGQWLLIIDMNLRLSNGIDAVKRLRGLEPTRNMIMGICTGSEDPADRRDAIAAGADFFIQKPLNLTSLERICAVVSSLEVEQGDSGEYHVWNHVNG
jgi:CheY-like chemotaxis protein